MKAFATLTAKELIKRRWDSEKEESKDFEDYLGHEGSLFRKDLKEAEVGAG